MNIIGATGKTLFYTLIFGGLIFSLVFYTWEIFLYERKLEECCNEVLIKKYNQIKNLQL